MHAHRQFSTRSTCLSHCFSLGKLLFTPQQFKLLQLIQQAFWSAPVGVWWLFTGELIAQDVNKIPPRLPDCTSELASFPSQKEAPALGCWERRNNVPSTENQELSKSFYPLLVSISIFMALSAVLHSINSPDNFPFSDCSFGLISALVVLSNVYLFMKVSFCPNIIPSGWPGSKHQLTN